MGVFRLDKIDVIEVVYNMFGGLYTKSEVKSLFDKFGLAMQDQLIKNGEIYIPHVGKIYINDEGLRTVRDFVNDIEFKTRLKVLRARPCSQLKKRMKEELVEQGDD